MSLQLSSDKDTSASSNSGIITLKTLKSGYSEYIGISMEVNPNYFNVKTHLDVNGPIKLLHLERLSNP